MTIKPDLLIGLSLGFSYEKVRGFIRSFRRFNQEAHVALILACADKASLDEFSYHARRERVELSTPRQIPIGFITRTNWRYFAYQNYLRNNQKYRRVLLSDVRDVFFQGDPFGLPIPNDVVCAVENSLIGQNRLNVLWLYKAYGAAMTQAMANRRVSCSGTTIGSYDGISRYCSLMCEEIQTHQHVETTDQAYHNFVYWNKNPGFMSLDVEERFFNTVGSKKPEIFEIDQDQVRVDGVLSIAVHQYDRHESLKAYVQEHYGPN
jgi:hypothetical protein